MENDNSKKFESVYTNKVRAGKRRTYFFDIRQTKGGDYYITLTESTKRFNGDGYERHKIYLYKEDFDRFKGGLDDVISKIKTEYMPDYDYDEFEKRQLEWEASHKTDFVSKPKVETSIESIESSASESTSNDASDSDIADSEESVSW